MLASVVKRFKRLLVVLLTPLFPVIAKVRVYFSRFFDFRKPSLQRRVVISVFHSPGRQAQAFQLASRLEAQGISTVVVLRDAKFGENGSDWDRGHHLMHVFSTQSAARASWDRELMKALLATNHAVLVTLDKADRPEAEWVAAKVGSTYWPLEMTGDEPRMGLQAFFETLFGLLSSDRVGPKEFLAKKRELATTWVNRIQSQRWIGDASQSRLQSLLPVLACPHCRSSLSHRVGWTTLECRSCSVIFPYDEFDVDLVNHDDVIGARTSIWRSWFESQIQSLTHYVLEPDSNVSHAGRSDVQKFVQFMGAPTGLNIVDVGCGVAEDPGYASRSANLRIGLDPYVATAKKAFDYKVRAISEYMPFKNESFDRVIYATSLDHVIDPEQALGEAKRILKNNGRIFIWDTMLKGPHFYSDPRYLRKFLAAHIKPSIWKLGGTWSRLFPRWRYHSLSSLRHLRLPAGRSHVPGRVDGSHLYRLEPKALRHLFRDLGLVIEREETLAEDDRFVQSFIELKKA